MLLVKGRSAVRTQLTVLALVTVVAAGCGSDDGSTVGAGGSGRPVTSVPEVEPCALAEASCDAVIAPREGFPPSQLPKPGQRPLTRNKAIEVARAYGSAPDSARVEARPMSYEKLRQAVETSFEDASISPRRALWVVTVHAPITTPAPPGQPPGRYPVYTVALDAATGFEVGLWAGLDAFEKGAPKNG